MILYFKNDLFNSCRAQLGRPLINLAALTFDEQRACYLQTRNAAYEFINANAGQLPLIPFPEKHPYAAHPVNTDFNTYIIGTFPPVSYLRDDPNLAQPILKPGGNILEPPAIPFYHGNMNSLWNILHNHLIPAIIVDRVAVRNNIIEWLSQNRINYFDTINECQRKNGQNDFYPASDSYYRNVIPNIKDIEALLTSEKKDVLIVTNTSSTFSNQGIAFYPNGSIRNPNNRAFDMLINVAQVMGYNLSFALQDLHWIQVAPANNLLLSMLMRTKVIFYLKVNETVFTIVSGPSPAGLANLQLANHPCYNLYRNLPIHGLDLTIIGFKKYVYRNAIARNFQALWPLNI